MKTKLFKYLVLILSICLFSTKIFAQEPPPGPGGDPLYSCVCMNSTTGMVSLQPFPIYFKKNNSEGIEIYGDDSQIRSGFDQQATIPFVDTSLQSFSSTSNVSKTDYRGLKNINAICVLGKELSTLTEKESFVSNTLNNELLEAFEYK